MAHLNPNRTGLIGGVLLGGWHAAWSLLVAAGLAQPVLDFIFWMHLLKPAFVVEPFDLLRAVILVLVTSAIGYVLGLTFGWLWSATYRD